MRYSKRVVRFSMAGLLAVIVLSTMALDGRKGRLTPRRTAAQTSQPAPVASLIYKPPLRGAPGGRVGGGTRGPENAFPMLSVLAPDHTGLTMHEQPALYWYLSKAAAHPIEVTIIEDQGVKPFFETRLSPPIQAGVQRVRLADYGVRLRPDVPYQWFVALIADPESRSQDIVAGGVIERVALSDTLRARLAQTTSPQALQIYAEAGLWYDAITVLSDLIEVASQDATLRQQRAALLEQVGLPEIAAYDRQRSR